MGREKSQRQPGESKRGEKRRKFIQAITDGQRKREQGRKEYLSDKRIDVDAKNIARAEKQRKSNSGKPRQQKIANIQRPAAEKLKAAQSSNKGLKTANQRLNKRIVELERQLLGLPIAA